MASINPSKWQRAALCFLKQHRDSRLLAIASPHRSAGLKTLAAFLIKWALSSLSAPDADYRVAFHPLSHYTSVTHIANKNVKMMVEQMGALCSSSYLSLTAQGSVRFISTGIDCGNLRSIFSHLWILLIEDADEFLNCDFQESVFVPNCGIVGPQRIILLLSADTMTPSNGLSSALLQRCAELGFVMPERQYIPWTPETHASINCRAERGLAEAVLLVNRLARQDEVSVPFIPIEVWFIVFDFLFSFLHIERPPGWLGAPDLAALEAAPFRCRASLAPDDDSE